MAIPILHLNLVPAPTLWRQNHELLGIAALAGGLVALALAGGISVQKYLQASREGRRIVSISAEARKVAGEQERLVDTLRQVDATERMPRYRLAERIFQERALPWSRLTAEMERGLVQDVRLRSLQRQRGADGSVTLKLRGEAKSRQAQAQFVEALQGNAMFVQVVLERETERAGGGIDFDMSLPVSPSPPAFEPVPAPPPQVVDQFGKPLQPGAKIVKTVTGAAPAPLPSPAPRPTAAPARPPAPPPHSAGPAAAPRPAQAPERTLPERNPGFNRAIEAAPPPPQPSENAQPNARPMRPPRGNREGGTP